MTCIDCLLVMTLVIWSRIVQNIANMSMYLDISHILDYLGICQIARSRKKTSNVLWYAVKKWSSFFLLSAVYLSSVLLQQIQEGMLYI